ncbi:zinc ribbon domain-containing protein [Francisella sp. 19X1-34]|uniref:zinc ribbon domain-containing protein n=1 Tax=Francisella sp. 19X1-34 TaxID=3087177 RepID=UPI002E34D016|nr:zinc ribbon domain-containing protein [Francisella sp. 19X1-34]MED7789248.1 zinc ribbon domain-containing protein [Francisella sp. 19X1-34]
MQKKNCECCLMPLSKDKVDNGSNIYCSKCFQNNQLKAENMSLKEFQEYACSQMQKDGKNKLISYIFSWLIKFAPYWKTRK